MKKLLFLAMIAQLALTFSSDAQSGIIATIAGTPGVSGYSGDGGPATAAEMNDPEALCLDASGNILFADRNYRLRKIDISGTVTTIAGNGSSGRAIDGVPATASPLGGLPGLLCDGAGNIFLAQFPTSGK